MSIFEPLHSDPLTRVDLALEDMRQGRMVILVDDEDRENEGDLVIAAEKITPEAINFMATHGRGLICLSLPPEQVSRLGLAMMATNNQSAYNTAFTVSIEAREGVSTGISAADRAHTTRVAISPTATPRDVVVPGHMFPLQARPDGVLERVGQTEGSVDLARLAGLNPSGVICEVMKEDGTMSRLPDLIEFGREHRIRIVAVADIIKYRMRTERIVRRVSEGTLEIDGLGSWQTILFRGERKGGLHLALVKGTPSASDCLVRVQSAPPPWAFLNADRASFAGAGTAALAAVEQAGVGCVVFMHLGGATLGALEATFTKDFEGAEARLPQARAEALRDLGTGCQILIDLGLRDLRLLTSSKRPIIGIESYGLRVVEHIPLEK
jgi:3,4-dihydroxy 2-butanone 4-phosphate synthase / GTP cyclohydrolase II